MLSVHLCLQLSFVRFLLPSYVLAKEIETIRNVRGLDHLFREFHTSINHELPDRGKHFEFEDFLRGAGHNKSNHPRDLPPRVLTDLDVKVSALPIETCPHSNGQCANSRVCFPAIRANDCPMHAPPSRR